MKYLANGTVRFAPRFTWGMRSLVLAVLYSHEVEAASVPALAPWVRLSRRVIRTALHHTAYSFGDTLVTPLAADLEARYGENWMEQPDIAALAERIRQVMCCPPKLELPSVVQ